MDKEYILDLFFNDILPSIARGKLRIEDAVYNIRFNTAIYHNGIVKHVANINNPELPTLTINDVETFSHHLLSFIAEVMNSKKKWCTPYAKISTQEGKIKYYLSLVWGNMITADFLNPVSYLKRHISFLGDNTFSDLSISSGPIAKLDDCYMEISNVEEKSCYETPYAIRVSIVDTKGHRFILPDVKYGIDIVGNEQRAYIYAVQYDPNLPDENEAGKKFRMKINRLLYRVNQDIPIAELDKKMETQGSEHFADENIVDVTPSSLVSLTVALSLLANEGITNVLVPSYLPIRWDSNVVVNEHKLDFYREFGYSSEYLDPAKEELEKEQEQIQRNVTDKFIRSFRRVVYHFHGINIQAFPMDVDDFMHLKLDSNFQGINVDHLLSNISTATMGNKKSNISK